MKAKAPTTKSLDKTEYELEQAYPDWDDPKKKHNPEITIIPYQTFGLGSKIFFEKSEEPIGNMTDYEDKYSKGAQVTSFYMKGGKIIIEAAQKIDKTKKIKIVNKIVDKIDFKTGLTNELFVEMLSNVFTEKQLNKFLKQKDLEILIFKGLMYLKSGGKAYRL